MTFDPAKRIQDVLLFGEFGGVNPSITDSATYTFMSNEKMEELFDHEIEGCFLYSRHWNKTNKYLSDVLALMEDGEAAHATASGMAAISSTLIQLCSTGDEIVSSRTVYGGTYALLKNLLPRMGISTQFVDFQNQAAIRAAITPNTRVLYCESMSNPLLEVSDIPALSRIAREHNIQLVVDNTFSPLILSPLRLGADVVIHSMTKFINGTSDCIAGCVISSHDFIASLSDINSGPCMLLGPVLDSLRAASLLKNLHSLHIRMTQHGKNALHLARFLENEGLTVYYPGLENHPHHQWMKTHRNPGYGYGGIVALDTGSKAAANKLMSLMQEQKVGYLAVSLGYFKTLFSAPAHSTSSEIPEDELDSIGIGDGLIRFSIGLDRDIAQTCEVIQHCLTEAGLAPTKAA